MAAGTSLGVPMRGRAKRRNVESIREVRVGSVSAIAHDGITGRCAASSSATRHQQHRCRCRQQPRAASIENPFTARLGKPATHVQTHIGIGADGDPFQHQEHRAQQRKLWRDRLAWHHELRQEGCEDQDSLRVAGAQLESKLLDAAFDP